MRRLPVIALLTPALALGPLACSDSGSGESTSQQGWGDEYGATPPMLEGDAAQDVAPALGKADGAGRLGPYASWDTGAGRVWEVTRQWTELDPTAGMAWGADSGLNWEDKYSAWVKAQPILEVDGDRTFTLITPKKQLPAPILECAEVAIFMRAAFAAWHGLPFFLTASDSGKPIHIGHFGFKKHDGTNYKRSPNFKTKYADYTSDWSEGQAWPSDTRLRRRGLYGGGDDHEFLPNVEGETAKAGAYFDEIFLNKRVGHFMLLALSWFGSMHLADGSNMFHITPESIRPGDVLLERWQRRGIGHTLPVMRVDDIGEGRIDVAVATGSMPRRQPVWEDGPAAARYFSLEETGGPGANWDEEEYAKLGGGIRRWRSALAEGEGRGARYRNTFLPTERSLWINSTDYEAIAARPARFGELMKELTADEKVELAIGRIENAREHLRKYPASCSARNNREDAFEELEEVLVADFGKTPDEVHATHRTFEDHVFAQLEYSKSKTCCWNSTTVAMHEIIMALNDKRVADDDTATCNEPLTFKAREVSDANDGYAEFRTFAEELGRGDDWVTWTADEPCSQADTLTEDLDKTPAAPNWCGLQTYRHDNPAPLDADGDAGGDADGGGDGQDS